MYVESDAVVSPFVPSSYIWKIPSPTVSSENDESPFVSAITDIRSETLALLLSLDFALDELFAEFCHFDVGELTVGGVNGDLDSLAIGLFFLDFLDMNAPLLTVHSQHFPHFILEVS